MTHVLCRPPRTPVLRCDKVIKKCNQTIKVTSQLTDGNRLKGELGTYKTEVRGKEGRGHAELIPLAMV